MKFQLYGYGQTPHHALKDVALRLYDASREPHETPAPERAEGGEIRVRIVHVPTTGFTKTAHWVAEATYEVALPPGIPPR